MSFPVGSKDILLPIFSLRIFHRLKWTIIVKPKPLISCRVKALCSLKPTLVMNPKDAYGVFGDNWRTILVNGFVLSVNKKQKTSNGPFQSYFTADFDLGEGITHRGDVHCGQIQLVQRGDNLQPANSDNFPMTPHVRH
jgi:hypothetical protein